MKITVTSDNLEKLLKHFLSNGTEVTVEIADESFYQSLNTGYSYDVLLLSAPKMHLDGGSVNGFGQSNYINVVKLLRSVMNVDLSVAKGWADQLVFGNPVAVVYGVNYERATSILQDFMKNGCTGHLVSSR